MFMGLGLCGAFVGGTSGCVGGCVGGTWVDVGALGLGWVGNCVEWWVCGSVRLSGVIL